MMKNHMEIVVEQLADKYMAETDMCRCERCKFDVMALALNRLPAAYVVTERGELFASIDASYLQNQVDADVAVLAAIAIVKEKPRH